MVDFSRQSIKEPLASKARVVQFFDSASIHVKIVKLSGPDLNRLHGMVNILKHRSSRWCHAGCVGVVDIVVAAVEQVQHCGENAPGLVDLVASFPVEQKRLVGTINSVRGQIARAKVAQPQTGRKAMPIMQRDARRNRPIQLLRAHACRRGCRARRHLGVPTESKQAMESAMSRSNTRCSIGVK